MSRYLSPNILRTPSLETLEESEPDIKDKLLQLIEDGDATVILSSEYTQSLNDLIKSEFISIENDRLQLTEKGQRAKILGIKKVSEQNPPAPEMVLNDFTPLQASKGVSNRSFLILLFFFLISLMAIAAMVITK